ncbi:hypothetical protein ESCAB7627_1690 [Escherichia albertii TW07627]|uniref:Uncharacterized protein n=1 Tax=Escherichia albertii (strain TW07627) TaxID=502347 RepID=A0ABC9NRI9_ESCAT|nr:hypothetical protein ESCAB7627_1690 [Escherichia albertii TW07627]
MGIENTNSSIPGIIFKDCLKKYRDIVIDFLVNFLDGNMMLKPPFIMKIEQ